MSSIHKVTKSSKFKLISRPS